MDENENCVLCRGTVAPDGRCWDCGAAQPSFRSRVEGGAAGGAAGVSDRGLRRGVNADAMRVVAAGEWTVGVVCDGVSMSPRSDRAALVAAPACTYVAAVVGAGGMWVSWVGDSRAYWLPDEGPGFALTEDDTGAHDAIAAWLGADAEEPVRRVRSLRPSVSGRLLLCTDGLWRYLPSAGELRAAVRRHRSGPGCGDGLAADARVLVEHALAAGGHDNVTALLIPVVGPGGAAARG